MNATALLRWAKENRLRLTVVALFLVLAAWGIVLAHYELVIGHSWWALLLTTACTGVAPELAGIVIGVVTIDYLNERRQGEQLKQQLILQMGSKHSDVADTATRALRAHGWLHDGSLKGATLANANLEGAHLSKVDLSGAMLRGANLSGAFLDRTNLEGANLLAADLGGAVLFGANLQGVEGWSVLQLQRANFLVGTTMPDGVRLRVDEQQARRAGVPPNPSGPTFEEWVARHRESIDRRAVDEARQAAASVGSEEE